MENFTIDGYKVNTCFDIREWGERFYDLPKDAIVEEEDNRDCMGFADLDNHEIFIFMSDRCTHRRLRELVAHEIGHLIEPKWTRNPDWEKAPDSEHEEKAMFYEGFFKTVMAISDQIILDSLLRAGA